MFWALRGGGGGTFGVVVSATIRTFPDAPLVLFGFVFNTNANNKSAYWNMVTDFHEQLVNISTAGGSGYYSVSGQPTQENGTMVRSLNGGFIFVEHTDTSAVQRLLKPLKDAMSRNANGPGFTFELMPLAKLSDWFAYILVGRLRYDRWHSFGRLTINLATILDDQSRTQTAIFCATEHQRHD